MAPIDDAIADLELTEEGADFALTQITDRHRVNRSTLSKRWRGLTGSQSDGYAQQQLLNPKQEDELVHYIEDLTAKLLPPTRQMIRNFSSEINCIYVSKAWVLCFLHHHHNMLTTKWSTAMESNCHAADSYNKYKLYFELLYGKMSEYHVLPHNTYNMDEKGFMIGVVGRTKQVFSKQLWEPKRMMSALQDGSRDWVMVVATICADGTTLPPGIIYTSANSTLQQPWVADVKAAKHQAIFTSSGSGWTNNKLGLV
jgi:hypothetical protein